MPNSEISSRTQNLIYASQLVDSTDGVSIPKFVEIPYAVFEGIVPFSTEDLSDDTRPDFNKPPVEAIEFYHQQIVESEVGRTLRQRVNPLLDSAPVIIRCAPLVSSAYSHLSFAGTFPSFVPKPFPQSPEAVDTAVASVLAGKHTRFADYYHSRHGIPERRLGVLAMKLVSGPAIHGTVYSMNHNVRSEHVFDPSLGEDQYGAFHFVRDRFGDTGSAETDEFCMSINFAERLTNLTREFEDLFGHAIDMEYLVDKEGILHVVQIRDMAQDHKSNWIKYYGQSHEDIAATSQAERRAIINSVGRFMGQAIEYSPDAPILTQYPDIQIVGHEFVCDFLERLEEKSIESNMDVIVRHGNDRIRDHLQYAALEDPAVATLAHIEEGDDVISPYNTINVYSNGDGFIHLG